MTATAADEALDEAHRLYFGRLVGWLFRKTADLQLAEDAVAAAFASAVSAWRAGPIPDSPEAWLRVVARNNAVSALRARARARARTVAVPPAIFDDREDVNEQVNPLDDRIGLLFVCAHPAIDPRMHAPLMLQTVLGVDAVRIASVLLVPPSTVGQRLSRAKAKIRDAGIRFRFPEPNELPARVGAVLQAVYAAYALADPVAGIADERDNSLRLEAVRLATLLTELLPGEAEVWGLKALLLHTESRRPARTAGGRFVTLGEQDTALWSAPQRHQADDCLRRASAMKRIGRFQLEAAISAVHSARAETGETDWASIVVLYRGLLRIAPSVGAVIGAASAQIETGELAESTRLLESLPPETVAAHQPYWVCRARLWDALGEPAMADSALEHAIGLTIAPAARRFLLAQHSRLPERPAEEQRAEDR